MDKVVYETTGKPVYVIQFETENKGEWSDSSAPQFRSQQAAEAHLRTMYVSAYPYRIVERV